MTALAAGAVASAAVPSNAGVVVFFVVGVLGGAHCLGMCGPLVTTYGERFASDGRGPSATALRQHALFNLGRTASYAAVGAAMGAVGGVLVDAGSLVSAASAVRGVVGVVAGLVVLAAGVGYLTRGRSRVGNLPVLGAAFAAVATRLHARVDAWAGGPGILALGAMHGLLPCPLLYPAFLYAAASGSPAHGALALAALGLGTFPTLFAYGTVLDAVDPSFRLRLHRTLGVAFLVAGTIPLANGLSALGFPVPHLSLPMPALP